MATTYNYPDDSKQQRVVLEGAASITLYISSPFFQSTLTSVMYCFAYHSGTGGPRYPVLRKTLGVKEDVGAPRVHGPATRTFDQVDQQLRWVTLAPLPIKFT